MRDIDRTKGQLINELVAMRQRIGELETTLGERDTVEEALQESIREFGLYFETITDVIYSIDPEFRIISVSPSVERILGYKPEELVGRRFQDSNVLAPEYLEKAASDILRVLAGENISSTEYEFIAKDGTRKFGEVSGAPIIAPDGKITGLVSIARDITERKRAEEALEESEENFRALAENSLDAITVFTEEGVPVYANKRAAEITGYSIAERTSKTFLEFVHHTEAKKLMARYRRRLEGKPVPSRYETVIVRKDGRSVPIELAATRTVWRGKPAVLVVYRDIAERKLTEDALRNSEEKLRLMFDSVTDGITVTDLEGKIVQLNDAVLRLHGYGSKEELIGHSAFELIAKKDHARAMENLKRTLKEGFVRNIEYTLLTKDRKEYDGELSAAVIRDASGAPAGFIAITRDITERKQTEKELIRLSNAVRMSTDSIVISDLDAKIVDVNEATLKMYGTKDKSDLIGKNARDFIAPEDRERALPGTSELIEKGYAKVLEYHIITKDGSRVLVEMNSALMRGAKGEPIGFVGVSRDITERKRAEEALKESEGKLRFLLENIPDFIITVDRNHRILMINRSVPGVTVEEAIGTKVRDYVEPAHHEIVESSLEKVFQTGMPEKYEVLGIGANGPRTAWYETRVSPNKIDDQVISVTLISSDITERKVAEDSLRHKEEYFRALTENSSDFIAVLNSDGSVRYESPSVERVLGYKPEERIGKSGLEYIHPEDLSEATDLLVRLVENPGTPVRLQARFQHKDGSWRVLDVVAQNLLDNPAVAGIVANMRDITEQKKAEQALRESEHNYRVLFESRIDGAAVIDAETMKVVLANPTAANMYGFDSMEEAAEANLIEYVHPDDRDRALTTIAEDLFEKDLRRVEEFRTLTKDGGVRWIAGVGTRVEYQGRLAALISFRDITEQKRMDERLRELYEQERESRQRVEAEMKRRVEFTRALAHELKTPLTSVLAASDLLTSELHDEPLLSLARNISQGASSLNSRIDELLDLARGEVGMLQLKLEPVDLLQLLRDTADSMRPLASSRGQSLTLDLPPSLPPVRADAARVQQVVTNLLGNAFKFTPVAGSITLRAKEKDAALVVEVRDTGPGMSKEEQKRLFEPYHRLHREPSGGLGLGLSLCKTLVELHGGQIWVRSNVGRGSTFGFSLPLEAADEQAVESEKPTKLWKVLIIEDDQEIVSFVSVAFQMRWPEAQLISSSLGEEGLELVETENPDLVILDLGLPDTSGFEVLRQIRLFSSVPVVILTVRADEADMVKGLEWGADDYVVKPFRQLELLARLKVQLRKQIPPGEEAPIICGSLRLDPSTYQLTYGGQEISLTIVEGRIMQHLMQNAGHVITHSRLAEAVWEEDHPGAVDSLRVYIRYLREKLEEDPSHPQLILTKVGIGYLLAKSV